MSSRALPDDPMHVRADEYGLLRVFAADRDDPIVAGDLPSMLGAEVDANRIEIADTRTVEGLGLTAYLAEGYGISTEDLADDREALDAIDGQVVLVPTSAFRGTETALSPGAPLRYVGLFPEEGARPPVAMSRKGTEARAATPPAPSDRAPVKRPWAIIAIALAVAALLVLVVVL